MIIGLLAILVNGIGISVGISYAYASVPVSFGLVCYYLVDNYECKNVLAMGDENRPDTYFSIGFGSLISAHDSTVGRLDGETRIRRVLDDAPGVAAIHARDSIAGASLRELGVSES